MWLKCPISKSLKTCACKMCWCKFCESVKRRSEYSKLFSCAFFSIRFASTIDCLNKSRIGSILHRIKNWKSTWHILTNLILFLKQMIIQIGFHWINRRWHQVVSICVLPGTILCCFISKYCTCSPSRRVHTIWPGNVSNFGPFYMSLICT